MYLWNYLSNELAENGQPAIASIGYFDEATNVILFTINEKKWQVVIPEGMHDRDAMILYMAISVPVIKDYLDDNDKERLFDPVITEIQPVVPEPEPEIEPVSSENNMLIVKCDSCGLFYDAAVYSTCPFCKNESETIIETDEIGTTGNDDNDISELATVRFFVNGELHSLVSVGDQETITLGRADDCTISFTEEKQLSRVHCSILYSDTEKAFYITDHSLNGVFDSTGNRLPKDTAVKIPSGNTFWIATKAMSLELTAAEEVIASENEVQLIPEQPAQGFCSRCGGGYTPDSIFCPWCGNRVAP